MLRIRSQTPPKLKAVHHRHCQVTQDDIGLAAGDLHQAFAPIGGEHHAEPELPGRPGAPAHPRCAQIGLNTPIPR